MGSKVAYYYSVLGLTGKPTAVEVKVAYRREMKIWHPDRRLHDGEESADVAHAKAVTINEAYEFLSELAEEHELPDATSSHPTAHDTYRTRHTYRKQSFTPGFSDTSVFEVFVKSSAIVSTGYNNTMHVLYLKFHCGSVYRYSAVPKRVFDELLSASSQGRYANKNIFYSFKYELC